MRNDRLQLSWQTRSLAMVIAAAGGNSSEELMKFASNLTIDKEEYEEFGEEPKPSQVNQGLAVNANTQELAAKRNLEAAADANANSKHMLALFGQKLAEGKPGHD